MTPWGRFVEKLPSGAKPPRLGPIRLVCFDMDGVLVEQESSWVAVHEHFGVDNEASLHAFLQGEISDEEFIRRDIALWKAKHPEITLQDIARILGGLRLMEGAQKTVEALHARGIETAIVSGGIHVAAEKVAATLGIRHVSANRLDVDEGGRLVGTGKAHTPLGDKGIPVRRFAEELGIPLGQVASVGNSSPDIAMFRTSGLGIAFRPSDEFVVEHADAVVVGPSLAGILPQILGT